jgi:hypothetical protein
MLDHEKRKDIMTLERQAMGLCRKEEISRCRAENRRKAEVWGSTPYKDRGRIHAATKFILVGIIAMVTTSLASLPVADGFKAYNCSNSSNHVEILYIHFWIFGKK